MKNQKLILVIVGIIIIGCVLYYMCGKKSTKEGYNMQTYNTTGSMQHLGAIIPDGVVGSYELVGSENRVPSLEDTVPAIDFASLVDSGDQLVQAPEIASERRPFERLQSLSDSYFPTVASKALPFSQAAAKPLTFFHAVNLPRVNLKGKLYEMNLSEAVRGTLPINFDSNISLVSTSQYRVEDSFNPGYMTSAFNSLHNKLTGGYKNLPVYIAGAGQAGGVGGNAIEAIYDS
jgi:hypothetical protein